jgi:leucyl aminopeptidase (aminopeptidase T)
VVAIEGGKIAKTFKGALERAGENAFHFSEFGFGASDKEKLGQGHRSKSKLGTVHFGLGDSSAYPGGTVHAATHLDGIIREARIEVDGKVMVENYTLKI